jgi:hypothetical protein
MSYFEDPENPSTSVFCLGGWFVIDFAAKFATIFIWVLVQVLYKKEVADVE